MQDLCQSLKKKVFLFARNSFKIKYFANKLVSQPLRCNQMTNNNYLFILKWFNSGNFKKYLKNFYKIIKKYLFSFPSRLLNMLKCQIYFQLYFENLHRN
jgi:hypothetical protein